MHPSARASARPRRVATVIAIAAVAALGLSGCGQGFEIMGITFPGARASTDVPDTVTPPGAQIGVGESARLPGDALEVGTGQHLDTEVGLTILAAEADDTGTFFDGYSNAADFQDVDPVFLTVQVEIAPGVDDRRMPETAALYGVDSAGEATPYLFVSGYESYIDTFCDGAAHNDDDGHDQICTVILVPKGRTLDHAEWDGVWITPSTGLAQSDTEDQPYASAPVRFAIPDPA